ncbi:hypothetical protein [Bacillus sp. FJAT-47783]|uniref:hypothetical protein n=1 Tax=Bacillus sp. FJAT-47783 TaxID=2922712 RepID=UPI001FAB8D9C|nr:hypothetical protein [Bacillus sp. FJAT-47783]
MNRIKLEAKVYVAAEKLVEEKGYVSPIDLLVEIGRLKIKQVEEWRFRKIPYLERVVLGNLSKMNTILKTLRKFAEGNHLKPSETVYRSWGKGPKKLLRFSKSGKLYVEKAYSTHYVKCRENKNE